MVLSTFKTTKHFSKSGFILQQYVAAAKIPVQVPGEGSGM